MCAKLSKFEQETIIIFNEESDTAEITTYNPRLKRALAQCSAKSPDCYRAFEYDNMERYVCPKNFISIRAPRQLSDETKQKLADRARNNFHRQGDNE